LYLSFGLMLFISASFLIYIWDVSFKITNRFKTKSDSELETPI
jgi:hypothetical protein